MRNNISFERITQDSSDDDFLEYAKLHIDCSITRWISRPDGEDSVGDMALHLIDAIKTEVLILLKRSNGESIWCLSAQIEDGTKLRIWELFVKPEERGKWIWTQALHYGQELIRELWYEMIYFQMDTHRSDPLQVRLESLAKKSWYTKQDELHHGLAHREYRKDNLEQ